MELSMRLDASGLARQTRIIRSSRYYPIDRAVLNELKSYRFNAVDLPQDKAWRVFFSWSVDGRETRLFNECVALG